MEITYEITPDDFLQHTKEAAKGWTIYTYSFIFMTAFGALFIFGDILIVLYAVAKNAGFIEVATLNVVPRFVMRIVIFTTYYVR